MKSEPNLVCPFCERYILQTEPSYWSQHGRKYGQSSDIIQETNHFLAKTGLGALTEGYLLVIPKSHQISIGAIPKNHFTELAEFCRIIRSLIESLYGPVILFEHGMSKGHSAGGCIDHAHIHFIPSMIDFRPFLKHEFPEKKIECFDELTGYFLNNTPYFFYENASQEKYVYILSEIKDIPSQYIRRLWAKNIGKSEEWDWCVFIGEENIAHTIDRIHDSLSLQSDILVS